jgi:methionyl-tRNA formyltransferase
MRIIFFGTPHFVIPVLQILEKNFQIVGIVTGSDQKSGRKQLQTPSPIKAYSLDEMSKAAKSPNEIPILASEDFSILNSQLVNLKPDLFVIAAYGKILPKDMLKIPPFGALCVHPSLLPKYRGSSPVQQTLLNGETVTGTTIIKIDEKMDHGPILSTELFEIHETDTYETLMTHLFDLGAKMLPDVIKSYIAGKIEPQQQDDSQATYTTLLTKDSGYINLDNLPEKQDLIRMIKAYYPWPGVWTKMILKNKELRIKFLPPHVCHPERSKSPASGQNEAFCIQIEGKKPITYKDFLNGYPEIDRKLKELLSY